MSYLYMLPGAFLVPIIHELVKALCSALLGDPTPKQKGFLTGNPLKFFEPIGFLLMMTVGYGWGQPVPTSPLHYKNRRAGTLITYITPSVVNLLLGMAAAFAYGMLPASYAFGAGGFILLYFAQFSIGLALFNIIPVYPLDGAKVFGLFMSPSAIMTMNRNEKMTQVVLLALLFFRLPQDYILDPIVGFIFNLAILI